MQENIKLIDLIIELTDARIPLSSRNPDIDELGRNKVRLILLNKADLAEDALSDEWVDYFRGKGYSAVKVIPKKAEVSSPSSLLSRRHAGRKWRETVREES